MTIISTLLPTTITFNLDREKILFLSAKFAASSFWGQFNLPSLVLHINFCVALMTPNSPPLSPRHTIMCSLHVHGHLFWINLTEHTLGGWSRHQSSPHTTVIGQYGLFYGLCCINMQGWNIIWSSRCQQRSEQVAIYGYLFAQLYPEMVFGSWKDPFSIALFMAISLSGAESHCFC